MKCSRCRRKIKEKEKIYSDHDCHLFGIHKGFKYFSQNFLSRDRCTHKAFIWHVWIHIAHGTLLCERALFVLCSQMCSMCIVHISYTVMAMIPTHTELEILLHRHCVNIWVANGTWAVSCPDVFLPLKVQQSCPEHIWSTAHGFIASALTRLLSFLEKYQKLSLLTR